MRTKEQVEQIIKNTHDSLARIVKELEKAKEEVPTPEPTYAIGDRFVDSNGNKKILIAVAQEDSNCDTVMFSNLKTGHGSRITVKNWNKITEAEIGYRLSAFTRYWNNQSKKKE
jgi:hypothetical protein